MRKVLAVGLSICLLGGNGLQVLGKNIEIKSIEIIKNNPIEVGKKQTEDFSNISNEEPKVNIALLTDYNADYNHLKYVSSVKKQGKEDLCWAFAANSILESAIMKTYDIEDPNAYNFSEAHMGLATSKEVGGLYGFDRMYSDMGDFSMAITYWSRNAMNGPVSEELMPYNSREQLQAGKINQMLLSDYYVTSAIRLENLSENSTSTQREAYLNEIKELIYNNGAVMMAYYSDDDIYKMTESYTSYRTTNKAINHGAVIVGWDDEFSEVNIPSSSSSKGAFLVKNSWGEQWGNMGGYFWLSYDSYIANVSAVTGASSRSFFDYIYEYDELGQIGSCGYKNKKTNAYMNAYTRETEKEVLTAVSTYCITPNSFFKVYVSQDGDTKTLKEVELSEEMALYKNSHGYQLEQTGYITLKLKTSMEIGEKFLVAIEIYNEQGGINSNIPLEIKATGYATRALSKEGEGFFAPTIEAMRRDVTKEDMAKVYNASICLKAFTKAMND